MFARNFFNRSFSSLLDEKTDKKKKYNELNEESLVNTDEDSSESDSENGEITNVIEETENADENERICSRDEGVKKVENDKQIFETSIRQIALEETYCSDIELSKLHREYEMSKKEQRDKHQELVSVYQLKKSLENYIDMLMMIQKVEKKHNRQLNGLIKGKGKGIEKLSLLTNNAKLNKKVNKKSLLLDKRYQHLVIEYGLIDNECKELRNENEELRKSIEMYEKKARIPSLYDDMTVQGLELPSSSYGSMSEEKNGKGGKIKIGRKLQSSKFYN